MQIHHERPDERLAYPVRAPLQLELRTGEIVTIPEWSLEGFVFPGKPDLVPSEGILSIPFQGVDIRFDVRFGDAQKDGFLRFDDLTGRQRETLALFYRSLLTGRMAQTGEIITSLDTPVDLVPMGETEEETAVATEGKPPRIFRVIKQVVIYLVLAALVFTTIGDAIWNKATTVQLHQARITAPMISHPMAREGYVNKIKVAPGDSVRMGDVLVVMSNPASARSLADVRSRISAGDRRLKEARLRLDRIETRIASMRADLTARITKLEQGSPEGASETPALRVAHDRRDDFDAELLPEAQPLFETRAAIQREVDTLDDTVRRLRRERGVLRDAEEAVNIRAAADGVVTEIHVTKHQFVARGTPVLDIEENTPRYAVGWAKPELAAALYPGMPVRARVNVGATARTLDAEIIRVTAGIDEDRGNTFGVLLDVRFPGMTLAESRETLLHGAPVEMHALRPTFLDWFKG